MIENQANHTNGLSTIGLSLQSERMQSPIEGSVHHRGAKGEAERTSDELGAQGQPKSYTLFPAIDSMAHFKHHLNMTLSKLRDPLTVPQAKEELNELMTEHVTNTDRMNTFLAALSGLNTNISTQGGSGGTS